MEITRPDYYKEFSCIAGACPDTCCAGWQIVIDDKSLKKYKRVKGTFRNRLHNDIDWKVLEISTELSRFNYRSAGIRKLSFADWSIAA